ncbi:hypothetical protein IWQ51_001511 [Labrenzia sp. EL_142]|nr:hypothetical protein [Labrenzia sp. EL_142]
MASELYKDFIKEAFIDPIRSVLIVDDDYPTLEEIIDGQIQKNAGTEPKSNKNWVKNPEKLKKVITNFRKAHSPLMIDIHDGSNVDIKGETASIQFLHQSDLLVLDYHLDPNDQNDGTRAIKIAQKVLGNDHFNLIIVHTRADLDSAFREMLLGLLGKAQDFISAEEVAAALEIIQPLEDVDPEISGKIIESLKEEHYLYFRKCGCSYPLQPDTEDEKKSAPSFATFNEICQDNGWEPDQVSIVARWALKEREELLSPKLNPETKFSLSWSNDGKSWIRSDSGFIAFSAKKNNDDLLDELATALHAWQPRPSRLFLSKLRAQIEKVGVAAESRALGSNHVLAHWYRRLLNADGAERDFYVAESVSRHSEQLMDHILPDVRKFANRIISADAGSGYSADVTCNKYFNIDLSEKAATNSATEAHNAFVCSKEVEGYHLSTGHIFKAGDVHWVCLSPACDLVPGQKKTPETGNDLPFIAVKLQLAKSPETTDGKKKWERWSKQILSNRFIFLKIKDDVQAFCVNNPEEEGSNPQIYTLYAKNKGLFNNETNSFGFLKAEKAKNHKLIMREYTAEVVSQLRYEYALNLMQKLGTSMTRIGLDFVSG